MKKINLMSKTGLLLLGAFFVACGGGGGGSSSSTPSIGEETAIDRIENYASGRGSAPTVADYTAAGVSGVTEDNLDEVNNLIAGLTAEEVDTQAEIQVLINGLGIASSDTRDKFKMTIEGDKFRVPVFATVDYNYNIDCNGDGINEAVNLHDAYTCRYAENTRHQIHIEGTFPQIFFGTSSSLTRNKLRSIDNWGTTVWLNMNRAFLYCVNLHVVAADTPNLSHATSTAYMFSGASSMDEDISAWDVSNIEDFQGMFANATSFNQDIGEWNVSSAKKMSGMFDTAISFNKNLSGWDVSHTTHMLYMFKDAQAFNQSLGAWNIGNVRGLDHMLDNSGLSTANYNSTLIGWSNLLSLQNNLILGASGLSHGVAGSLGATAYESLTNRVEDGGHAWTINDAGT